MPPNHKHPGTVQTALAGYCATLLEICVQAHVALHRRLRRDVRVRACAFYLQAAAMPREDALMRGPCESICSLLCHLCTEDLSRAADELDRHHIASGNLKSILLTWAERPGHGGLDVHLDVHRRRVGRPCVAIEDYISDGAEKNDRGMRRSAAHLHLPCGIVWYKPPHPAPTPPPCLPPPGTKCCPKRCPNLVWHSAGDGSSLKCASCRSRMGAHASSAR
eukprot:scaffold11310_cov107-Isochrysis_galbana.AAC.5